MIKKVHTYFIQIKNTSNHAYLTSDEIKRTFDEISNYQYTRNDNNSMLRCLNDGEFYLMDINPRESRTAFRINASKVRDDDLPTARYSKEEWRQLQRPPGADIIETSIGVFYFCPEITHGCILFLKRNVLGMSVSTIYEYVKKCFPSYNVSKSLITQPRILHETFNSVQEARYLILNNKTVMPGNTEGLGDYHYRTTHPDDLTATYSAIQLKLDLEPVPGTTAQKIRKVIRDFTGTEPSNEQIHEFLAESNAQLYAIKQGNTRQEKIDLSKSLYSFDYEDINSDPETFYQFCDEKFSNPTIKRELISLALGIIANTDVDDQE